jgi:hypothetical protein
MPSRRTHLAAVHQAVLAEALHLHKHAVRLDALDGGLVYGAHLRWLVTLRARPCSMTQT